MGFWKSCGVCCFLVGDCGGIEIVVGFFPWGLLEGADVDLDLPVVSLCHVFPSISLFLQKIPFHHQLSVSLDKLIMYFHISTEKPGLLLYYF